MTELDEGVLLALRHLHEVERKEAQATDASHPQLRRLNAVSNGWDMARTADTYTNWARMYEEATQALTDRERRIHETCDMIEQNLFLLGASAIEDKLQDKACHALCRPDLSSVSLVVDPPLEALVVSNLGLPVAVPSSILVNELVNREIRRPSSSLPFVLCLPWASLPWLTERVFPAAHRCPRPSATFWRPGSRSGC
jgi:hypothetical protein